MDDLVVIGAGMSGLMAAYVAAKAGLKVKVIAKGLGSLHWSAGTIDVLGYLQRDADKIVVREPMQQLQDLIHVKPGHPYGLLNHDQIAQAIELFAMLSEDMDLPYGGSVAPGENILLPTAVGAIRPVFLAPIAQLAGDLSRPEPMLIAGFEGVRDFYPGLIAQNLNKLGYQARPTFLPLSTITGRRDSNNVDLARGLDDRERRGRLINKLRQLIEPGERVGIPAILGLNDHDGFMSVAQGEGLTLFEIPTLPPSVPGYRLYSHLQTKLSELGVRIDVGMEVIGFETQIGGDGTGPEIKWLESETAARPMIHRAGKFLLATGGILGGGFSSDSSGRVWEVIFDLPLTVPQERGEWFRPSFLDPLGHPVFYGGVYVNETLQPVDKQGKTLLNNLWVAGNGLAGHDSIIEGSMTGLSMITGIAAGQAICGV